MADGGYLVSPSEDPSKEEIWVETRKRLSRFLPDLFSEIFPDTPNELEESPDSAVSSPEQPRDSEKADEKSKDTALQQDTEDAKEAANADSPTPQEAEETIS
mgnify:CR=1 FL=1